VKRLGIPVLSLAGVNHEFDWTQGVQGEVLKVFTVKVSFRLTLEDILTKVCHICLNLLAVKLSSSHTHIGFFRCFKCYYDKISQPLHMEVPTACNSE